MARHTYQTTDTSFQVAPAENQAQPDATRCQQLEAPKPATCDGTQRRCLMPPVRQKVSPTLKLRLLQWICRGNKALNYQRMPSCGESKYARVHRLTSAPTVGPPGKDRVCFQLKQNKTKNTWPPKKTKTASPQKGHPSRAGLAVSSCWLSQASSACEGTGGMATF